MRKDLSTARILSYSQPRGRIIIVTDASNFETGGMLSQVEDGQERIIAYNKALNKAEINYCVTRPGTTCNHKDTGTFP
jgi:hypothetical protein